VSITSSERAFPRLTVPRSIWSFGFSRELAVYLIFGGTAAIVNLETGWLLYGSATARLQYWLATGIAAAAGLVTNFGLNYLYNFKFRNRSAVGQFVTFSIISGLGVLLTAGLATAFRAALYHLVGPELELYALAIRTDFVAHVAAVGALVVYSYPAHKAISFNVGLRARLRQLATLMAI
jgi:putative flippase GtrA